ncbi:hypothetical protein M758_10G104100 [Ceratodon purpureus]|nr:hypothetical protein M758_10G104100 [Ceratodon purpureus]
MEEEEASSSGGDEFESKKEARSRKRRESHAEALQEGGEGQGEGEGGAGEKKRRKKSLQDGRSSVPGKRGVVYLSRIPPHMKPLKLRHLLESFGEVLRIYLAPEDAAARMRRKRAGGNTGKNFTEGWVEFAHKSDAKRIAIMLNGEPMEASKRSAYHYDLWNMKYLKRFKWDNLTEEIAYKNAVREQRLAAEISAAKKERDFYLSKVDQSRAIASMEERKKKKKELELPESEKTAREKKPSSEKPRVVRNFNQKKPVADGMRSKVATLSHDVLAGVFGKK